MNDGPQTSISELLNDHALITEALSRGVLQAVLQHARSGQPVATWKDGKVVWISPAEILSRFSEGYDKVD